MANTSFYKQTGATATAQNTIQTSVDAAALSATNSATSETNSAASAAASLASQNASAASAAAALVSQNAAASSASTASGHATSTAGDAVATAADRVQTGLDRTAAAASAAAALVSENAAAADAAQVSTDAAQVAADKIQTAADRVQTGLDVTASAASAAAALVSENASAGSAAAALVSENAAAASASTASGHATSTAADAVATAADAVATAADRVQTGLDRTAAATSATDAETALDDFTDLYIGAKNTSGGDPTTDNDGDALQTGALMYDTTNAIMKTYNGSAWVAAFASSGGALLNSNNLSDVSSVSAARTNLGLGTAATTAATDYATAAQGALAASALQSGDNVSTLTNDSGYITSVPAQTFASLTGKPTTIAGYGITDAFNGAFSSLTGKPSTIAGYGITDAFNGVFSSLSGKPTTIAGYGITDAFDGAYGSLTGTPTIPTNNNQLTNGAGYITSVPAQSFASLTGKPTTIAGYGITDAFDGAYASLTGKPTIPTNNNQLTNGAGYTTNVGDITHVTAGVGLTGGGASGSVTVSVSDDVRVASNCFFGNSGGEYGYYDNTNSRIRWFINSGEEFRMDAAGDFHADGNVIAYSTTISDERLKTDIIKIDSALDKVGQLNGYTFTYTTDGKKSAGVIAQEVEKVLPSAVSEKELPLKTDDGVAYKTVQYDQLVGLLIEAVKELSARVEELENASTV